MSTATTDPGLIRAVYGAAYKYSKKNSGTTKAKAKKKKIYLFATLLALSAVVMICNVWLMNAVSFLLFVLIVRLKVLAVLSAALIQTSKRLIKLLMTKTLA